MKKRLWLVSVALIVIAVLLLSLGCQKPEQEKPGGETSEPGEAAVTFPEPGREILQLVPFGAGGGFDTTARYFAQHLTEDLGVPVITENRTGSGGIIPLLDMQKTEPDGYTLTLVARATHPPQQALHGADIRLDQLTYIAGVKEIPYILVVSKDSDIEALEDLKEKDHVILGTSGSGHISEIAAHQLADALGFELRKIPYDGLNAVGGALLSGEVDMAFLSGTIIESHKDNLRLIATFTEKRSDYYPDVPTIGELGYDLFLPVETMGYVGPPGMDPQVVEILRKALENVVNKPETREWAASLKEIVTYIPPEEVKRSNLEVIDICIEYKDILLGSE
jgi:tripartite-type tricarboxylate transporter receptor subunit TctC